MTYSYWLRGWPSSRLVVAPTVLMMWLAASAACSDDDGSTASSSSSSSSAGAGAGGSTSATGGGGGDGGSGGMDACLSCSEALVDGDANSTDVCVNGTSDTAYAAYRDCCVFGACQAQCGGDQCFGAQTFVLCQNCLANTVDGCGTELMACSADLP